MRSRLIVFTCLLVAGIADSGCCRLRQMNQPAIPANVRGWKEERIGNEVFLNRSILKKGVGQDNGALGIKLVEVVHPPCKSMLSMDDSDPLVKLQFYDAVSHEVFCETQFISGGYWDRAALAGCNSRLSIDALVIYKINSRDNWILISLIRNQ